MINLCKQRKQNNDKSFAVLSVMKDLCGSFYEIWTSVLGSAEMSPDNRHEAQFETFLAIL